MTNGNFIIGEVKGITPEELSRVKNSPCLTTWHCDEEKEEKLILKMVSLLKD